MFMIGATRGSLKFRRLWKESERALCGYLYRFPTFPTFFKVGRNERKSHSVWEFTRVYDKRNERQFEFPTFMNRVGTRYVWLFIYVYDDFRLLGPGKFKILKG